jgi:hypothetical protein
MESYVARALAALDQSAAAGFFRDPARRDQARADTDLLILRGRDEFRRILHSEPQTLHTDSNGGSPNHGP